MIDKDQADRLERHFATAGDNVRKTAGKAGEGAEKKYGQAFTALVRAGLRRPLKKRYR